MEEQNKKSTVERIVDFFYDAVQWVCVACLAGQVVVVSYTVFGRFVLNDTPPWGDEIARVLMVWMSLLSASLAVRDDTHVRITMLDRLFGTVGRKIRDTIFAVMNIAFCGVLFWKGIDLIEQTAKTKLPGSGLPSSILYASVCVGGLAMAVMLVYRLGRELCQRK